MLFNHFNKKLMTLNLVSKRKNSLKVSYNLGVTSWIIHNHNEASISTNYLQREVM